MNRRFSNLLRIVSFSVTSTNTNKVLAFSSNGKKELHVPTFLLNKDNKNNDTFDNNLEWLEYTYKIKGVIIPYFTMKFTVVLVLKAFFKNVLSHVSNNHLILIRFKFKFNNRYGYLTNDIYTIYKTDFDKLSKSLYEFYLGHKKCPINFKDCDLTHIVILYKILPLNSNDSNFNNSNNSNNSNKSNKSNNSNN
jgi:hypothetical protein